jgi:hypothetical protein
MAGTSYAPPVVQASDGVLLPLDQLTQTMGYTNGSLTTITVVFNGNTYIQTLTYSNGVLSTVSPWVKQ